MASFEDDHALSKILKITLANIDNIEEEKSAARHELLMLDCIIKLSSSKPMSDHELKVPPIREPKPMAKGNKRIIFFIILFFITILVILFFQSSISKISIIEIEGTELISTTVIGQASGIEIGDQFLGFSSRTVAHRIEQLPTIHEVEVTKRFPGRVIIKVTEYPRVAFQLQPSGEVLILFADGSYLPAQSGIVMDKPILSGWNIEDSILPMLCKVLSEIPDRFLSDVSEISPDPTLAYPDKVKIYTRSQFEVSTTIGYMAEKIRYLDIFVAQLQQDNIRSGLITMLETDKHSPFPEPSDTEETGDRKSVV